jgi:hypothetical protein
MKKGRRDIIKLSGIVATGLAMGGCGSSTASPDGKCQLWVNPENPL